tara:strand:+ start:65 stop:385 length:321 start_codon:yes stop_codon:yes gene_type:complete
MRYIKILIFINLIFLINSCGTLKEGFTNQKKNSNDEFLVEKKSPLAMPPDFNELPMPKTNDNEKGSDENSIKDLITSNNNRGENQDKTEDLNRNFEESLLEKINQN